MNYLYTLRVDLITEVRTKMHFADDSKHQKKYQDKQNRSLMIQGFRINQVVSNTLDKQKFLLKMGIWLAPMKLRRHAAR